MIGWDDWKRKWRGLYLAVVSREERDLKFGKLAMLDDLRVELQKVWIGLIVQVEIEGEYSSTYPLSRGGINHPLLTSHR